MNVPLDLPNVATIVIKQLTAWLTYAVKILPNLVVAFIVVVVFWLLSVPAGQATSSAIQRLSASRRIPKLLGRLARVAVIVAGLVLALDVLNLDKAVASVLAGIGIVGFALSYASKDIAANFMAGLFLTFIHPIRTGDLIRCKNFYGRVKEIDMHSTTGVGLDGETVILPNKDLMGDMIINYTDAGKSLIILTGTITYKNDLQEVEELAVDTIKSLSFTHSELQVEFLYKDFGSNTINFVVRFWTAPEAENLAQARSEAIKAIKSTFENHEISMVP